ncbi:hypothetical protein AAMO2058_000663300 [Amorphochlora amoebiformis]|mmetsp:Transcript_25954/g.41110  ORF Transcript_25954/g.41110 Transcript_25954/m.41110 type:complete len:254 (-) Transcript_25954:245-1006(-)
MGATCQPCLKRPGPSIEVQAVIFDLDGTLIDYEEASRTAMCDVLKPYGKTVEWSLHSRVLGRKMHDVATIILDSLDLNDQFTPDSFVSTYYKRMGELYKDIKPMDGVLSVMKGFKEMGIPMVIATSSYEHSYVKKMKFHKDIESYVHLHVCGDDPEVKNGKPAPDIFLCAKKRLEKIVGPLEASKCIVFEDSPFGLQGAYAAGMMGVALPDPRIDHKIAGTDFSKAKWVCNKGIKQFLNVLPTLKKVPPTPMN